MQVSLVCLDCVGREGDVNLRHVYSLLIVLGFARSCNFSGQL